MPSEMVMVLKMRLFPSGRVHAARGLTGQLIDVDITWRDLAPGAGDTDLVLLEVIALESYRVQHRAAGRAIRTVHENGGVIAVKG